MPVRFTFTGHERLCRSNDFLRVKKKGRCFFNKGLVLNILNGHVQRLPRLGLVVGRTFGNAVKRNRIKRLLREVFRKNKHMIVPGTDIVAIPKQELQGITYPGLEQIIMSLCKKARVLYQAE